MSQACPINFTTIDNTLSRVVSLLTVIVVSLFFLTQTPLLLLMLCIDLVIRLYGNTHMSPLFQSARALQRILRLPIRRVDGGAKRVAGHFGLLFALLMLAAFSLNMHLALVAIAATYVLCLLLDTFLNFCAGCKIYHLYRMLSKAQ